MDVSYKIGTFSEKFQISASTVRYYIQLGMLIPEVQNGQYRFNSRCIRDMEQIMEWKDMEFPLKTIHELITLKRKYSLLLQEDIVLYLDRFVSQEKYLVQKLDILNTNLNNVDILLESVTNENPISQYTNTSS